MQISFCFLIIIIVVKFIAVRLIYVCLSEKERKRLERIFILLVDLSFNCSDAFFSQLPMFLLKRIHFEL